ncbi:pyruvate kinase 1, cytosolic [Tanacetum coccineum]
MYVCVEFLSSDEEDRRARSRSVNVIFGCLKAGMSVSETTKGAKAISIQQDDNVILTLDNGHEAISQVLPINFDGLAKAVKKGDTIFVGQYLFTGSETTSVWLEVDKVDGNDVDCKIQNSATLAGAKELSNLKVFITLSRNIYTIEFVLISTK